jgi:hypothetical protein
MIFRPQLPHIGFLLSQSPLAFVQPVVLPPPPLFIPMMESALVMRGAWDIREDAMLREAVNRFGTTQWDIVAAVTPGRSATQCRERWMFRTGSEQKSFRTVGR